MRKVIDAFTVLCWMQQEPGHRKVQHILEDAEKGVVELFISAINIGEVYYSLLKSGRATTAEAFLMDVKKRLFPWRVVAATNQRVWQAARLKGLHRISYADAFAIALAQELGAILVTGDPEIRDVESTGGLQVEWLEA